MLVTSNRLAIGGTAFLAAGMTATVFLITDVLFSLGWAGLAAGLVGGGFCWLWYGLPLVRAACD